MSQTSEDTTRTETLTSESPHRNVIEVLPPPLTLEEVLVELRLTLCRIENAVRHTADAVSELVSALEESGSDGSVDE